MMASQWVCGAKLWAAVRDFDRRAHLVNAAAQEHGAASTLQTPGYMMAHALYVKCRGTRCTLQVPFGVANFSLPVHCPTLSH